jgi:UDP-3-O-[3-hydroxymyristoyl] N-acetylglucosamine deacetylase
VTPAQSTKPPIRQTTLRRAVTLQGRGAHTNRPASVTLSPAEANAGILFQRAESDAPVEALWSQVTATQLRTLIGVGAASVATIEHLTAALAGLGVDNVMIDVDGPEAPAMDGSARTFVAAVLEAGIARLAAPRRRLKILKTVRVDDGASFAELAPMDTPGLHLDVEIDFPHPLIGRQRLALTLTPESFVDQLASARSFGFLRDAERLWRAGLALGASLDNCVILDDRCALNPQGLRFADEFVRHKALDVVGDLALAGAPIEGAFRSYRGGHKLNLALVEALMTTPDAFCWRDVAKAQTQVKTQIQAQAAPMRRRGVVAAP